MEQNLKIEVFHEGFKCAEFTSRARFESWKDRLKEQYNYDRGIFAIVENGVLINAFRHSQMFFAMNCFQSVPLEISGYKPVN